MEKKVDVLICGSGSAGITAAAWLARYGIRCKILEAREGPLQLGKADGVQCRTVEMFESFGLADDMLREAYHVLEVAFWSDKGGPLICTRRTADTAPGLSHQPHVILNQARVNGILINAMKKWNRQEIDYGYTVKSVVVDSQSAANPEAYAVTVVTERAGREEVFKAKYALGCDGAHSAVRRSLGFKMIGDTTDSVWGVMDIYPRTNFPDIRKKVVMQTQKGSLLIIPREGGSLVRFYIELPHGTEAKDVKLEALHAAARLIFDPYSLEIAETFWWSAYSIGQRLADHFSKDNRVFLTGDACHTHSPKAGQGMNTSSQDGYNIGWKLAAILKGQATPELLKTYNLEREKVAADLISFDREFAKLFSSKLTIANGNINSTQDFSQYFIEAGRYTAGLAARYADSPITSAANSLQSLARNLTVGMRFPSAQVVRFCDARAMQLVKALPADGRWRIVIFAGDICFGDSYDRLVQLGKFLDSREGPIRLFTPATVDIDSVIESIVIFSTERSAVDQTQIPEYFCPIIGKWKMRDLHKIFVDDESYNSGHGKAYEFYGVEKRRGAIAIVRPDQYVSLVIDVDDHASIGVFFRGILQKVDRNTMS